MPLSSVFSSPNRTFFDTFENATTGKSFHRFQQLLPDANNIAASCSYRDWSLDRIIDIPDSQGCSEYFHIKTYRLQGYFCWLFNPPEDEYSFYAVINTLNDRRVLYNLAINDRIAFGYKFRPMAHHQPFPIDDVRFGDEVLSSTRYNESFPVTYAMYRLETLPPPYITKCRNDTEHHCFARCFTLTLAKKGISPINNSPDVDDASLPIIRNVTSMDEEQVTQLMHRARRNCVSSCSNFRPCSHVALRTEVPSPLRGSAPLEFSIETISEPVILTRTGPKLTLIDLLYQITTLAGSWIGFSVYHAFLLTGKVFTRQEIRKQFNSLRMKYKSTCRIRKKLTFILTLRFGLRYQLRKFLHKSHENVTMNEEQININRVVKFLSFLVKIIAVVALTIQIVNICQSYFEYSIRTVLEYSLNPQVGTPVIAFCVSYVAMMNPPTLPPINRENYNFYFHIIDQLYGNLSMIDLLDKTWQPDEIMKSCRWRDSNSSQMLPHDRDECYSAFNITRFFLDKQICFRFSAINRIDATQLIQKSYPSDPGLFFSIVFSEKMSKLSNLLIIIFDPSEDVPLESRDYAANIFPRRVRKFFIASMSVANRFSLPAPYVTNCQNNATTLVRRCIIRKTREKFSRNPHTEVFTEQSIRIYSPNQTLVSYADINSTEGIIAYKQIEDECDSGFYSQECKSHIVKTFVQPPYRSYGELEVAVDAHAYPELNTFDRPALILYDFYFLTLSTVTFWTAITMLSFNPSGLILKYSNFRLQHTSYNTLKKIENNIDCMKYYLNFVLTLDDTFLLRHSRQSEQLKLKYNFITLSRFIKGKYLLHILCTFGCTVHLYQAVSEYLRYLTVLNTQSHRETNESFPDLTLCFSTYDLLSKNSSFISHHDKKYAKDPFPPISLTDIFAFTPPIDDLMVACGHRGLQFDEQSIPLLTKRIFFQQNNKTLCNSLFDKSKFLLQGYVCYRYRKKHVAHQTKMEVLHQINVQRAVFSLTFDSNFITDEFSLAIGDRTAHSLYGSIWAPSIDKKGSSIFMSISYVKYLRYVLPPPYFNWGFTDESLFRCIHFCLLTKLEPMGLADPGYFAKPLPLHYITASERDDLVLKTTMQSLELHCARDCSNQNVLTSSSISSYIPLIDEWRETNQTNSTEFEINQTEFPVISVIFSPQSSFFQLTISIGSILGIWYGLSAVHFDPSRLIENNSHEVTTDKLISAQQQLTFLSESFYQLNLYFITHKFLEK